MKININNQFYFWVGIVLALICLSAAGPIIDRLNSLSDVQVARPPNNGDLLVYNGAARKWTNGTSGTVTNVTVVDQFVTNYYSSNFYTTNLIAVDVFTTNIYSINDYTTNLVAVDIVTSNFYTINLTNEITMVTSNLYAVNVYTTNTYSINQYTTNLVAMDIVTSNFYTVNFTNETTLVTSNLYTVNIYTTNLTAVELVTSNLTTVNITNFNTIVTSNFYTTNSYSSNSYTINQITTNLIVRQSSELNNIVLTNSFRTLFYDFTGSTNIDSNLSSFQGATLSANTAFHLSNSTNGTRLLVRFIQDGTGGWSPTIDNVNWVFTPNNWNTNAGGISYVVISDTGNGTADATLIGVSTATSGTGTTVSVNATNVNTPNLTDSATVTFGLSGSNITATAINRVESITALTWAGTTTISVASSEPNYRTLTLGGDTIFATSNKASGHWFTCIITGAATNCAVTWPSWVPMNQALPATITAGKHVSVTVFFTDTSDANAIANLAAEP